jgi:hypothetical protein
MQQAMLCQRAAGALRACAAMDSSVQQLGWAELV